MNRVLMILALLAACFSAGSPALAADTAETRLQAAQRLFDLPTYRQLATRQIYAALKFLPAEEYRHAAAALADPQVVQALQGVIARSMAQTFSLAELENLERFLASDETRTMMGKMESLQSVVIREMIASTIADPELARNLLAR